MAFEPLETDEKLSGPPVKRRDMDDQMLFGCSGFVLASLLGYGLGVWPFFAIRDIYLLPRLALALGIGLGPMLLLAFVMARKFGLAGLFGAIGGAMAVAMFLYLRIEQVQLAYLARQSEAPEFPPAMQAVLPIAWVLAVALVALLGTRKEEIE